MFCNVFRRKLTSCLQSAAQMLTTTACGGRVFVPSQWPRHRENLKSTIPCSKMQSAIHSGFLSVHTFLQPSSCIDTCCQYLHWNTEISVVCVKLMSFLVNSISSIKSWKRTAMCETVCQKLMMRMMYRQLLASSLSVSSKQSELSHICDSVSLHVETSRIDGLWSLDC